MPEIKCPRCLEELDTPEKWRAHLLCCLCRPRLMKIKKAIKIWNEINAKEKEKENVKPI